ncbi:MAG: DCC1-like thiol-disulfide oxidoreductase family protein [Verrucomicrobiota bacterium]
MKQLTIFYDAHCGLCTKFRYWLLQQRACVPLVFLPYDAPAAEKQLPTIDTLNPDKEIIVLADDGRWWQGPPAWLTCLWTLKKYRPWAKRLAHPTLLPVVEKLCHLLAENRFTISELLHLKPDQLAHTLKAQTPKCTTSACTRPKSF